MKTRTMYKLGSYLLTLTLLLGILPIVPQTARAEDIELAESVEEVTTGTGTTAAEDTTIVGFGGRGWYVIGYNGYGVKSSANTITLLSKGGIGTAPFGDELMTYPNMYQSSRLKYFLETEYNGAFFADNREKAIVNGRTFDDIFISGSHFIWPLSYDEATMVSQSVRALSNNWWLRTPGSANNLVIVVDPNGTLAGSIDALNSFVSVRPALQLKLDTILFSSSAVGGKKRIAVGANLAAVTQPGNSIKFTITDNGNLSLNVTDHSELITNQGGSVSIPYTGAQTAANKYVSCIILDNADTMLYYGKLATAQSGMATINIPSDMPVGSYTIKLFNEEINGDYESDYASNCDYISLTVGTVPAISGGDSSKELTVGYSATSTSAFTITGDPTPTVEKVSGNDAITWNDTNKTLDIAAGLGAGQYPVEIKADNGINPAATHTFTLTVNKADQTISGLSDMIMTYGDAAFTITPSAQENPSFTFESDNTAVATIASDGTINIIGAGETNITVKAEETDSYKAAEATYKLTVNKAENIITDIPPVNKTYGDPPFTVIPQANENPMFSFTSDNSSVAAVDPATGAITFVSAGSTIITVTAAETANYEAATAQFSVNVNQSGGQQITGISDYNVTYGDPNFSISPSGLEDPTFRFESNDISVVTVDSNTGEVSIVGAGSAIITVTAEATTNYTGTSAICVVAVAKAEQTLTGLQDLLKINHGDDFTVTPNSNAAIENPNISFYSSNVMVIDFDTNKNFVIKGTGTATITVKADETANYNAATETFEIKVLADTADLKTVIDAVQDLIDGLQTDDIGNGNGQYPQDAVGDLKDAIDAARDVANDTNASQEQVDKAKEDLLQAIDDFQNSLIRVDFTALDNAIITGKALEKGTYTDVTWTALQTALTEGQEIRGKANVTQAEVDEAKEAINNAIAALSNEYKFTSGFGTFTGSGDLTGTANGPYDKFVRLLINGEEVNSKNYTIAEGSTVITLKEAYLKTLANGTYTVKAEFTDDTAETTLTVKLDSNGTSGNGTSGNRTSGSGTSGSGTSGSRPKTGDDSVIWSWLALMAASLGALCMVLIGRKRKKRKV